MCTKNLEFGFEHLTHDIMLHNGQKHSGSKTLPKKNKVIIFVKDFKKKMTCFHIILEENHKNFTQAASTPFMGHDGSQIYCNHQPQFEQTIGLQKR